MTVASTAHISANYPSHWQTYFQENWGTESFSDESVPFHGTGLWKKLSLEQKEKLCQGFIQINAEVIIHLEQGLLIATRALKQQGHVIDDGLKAFINDEILHIDAFRDYLHKSKNGNWPKESLLLFRRDRYRRFCAWLYKWEPLCVFLPGAKSEIYAVQYHVTLKAQEKENKTRWSSLVHSHAIDEASHISKDFDLLREELKKMNLIQRAKLYFATLLCVAMTQYSLTLPAWRLICDVFPEKSWLSRLILTSRFAAWVLWIHPAFPATRKVFRRALEREKDSFFRHFAFLGW
jgi:hypothetical protein